MFQKIPYAEKTVKFSERTFFEKNSRVHLWRSPLPVLLPLHPAILHKMHKGAVDGVGKRVLSVASKLESTLCFVASAAGGDEEEGERKDALEYSFFLRRVRMHALNSTGQR